MKIVKKKKRIKWKNIFLILIIVGSLITFVYSSYKIIYRMNHKRATNKLIDNINSLVEIKDNEGFDIENIPSDFLDEEIVETEEKINYYYEYLKVPFISVDFNNLKDINNETVGWINVVGAGINYPYVQTSNNSYYLNHAFDKTYNEGGWVFLDYRNSKSNKDQNTIIYAHGGMIFAMFGPLKNLYTSKDWFNNKDNHYIKISTEEANLVYKVFSLYVIPTTSDYLYINFDSLDNYQAFLDKIIKRSYYNFETEVNSNNRIITLSTCYNKKEKLVIHGKLIKEEKR